MHQEIAQGLRGMEARDLDSAPQFSSRLEVVSEAITRCPAMDPMSDYRKMYHLRLISPADYVSASFHRERRSSIIVIKPVIELHTP